MNKYKKYRSDFLFVKPTFLMGAGNVLNIAGNYFDFNYSLSDLEADAKAIEADWGLIGNDIESAAVSYEESLNPITESSLKNMQ